MPLQLILSIKLTFNSFYFIFIFLTLFIFYFRDDRPANQLVHHITEEEAPTELCILEAVV